MSQATWRGAASLLVVIVIGAAVTAGDVAMKRPDPVNSQKLLLGDAARMHLFVTTPHPGELKWQQIPWLTDLQAAIRQAKVEKRPLLLFVSGDEPLEKC